MKTRQIVVCGLLILMFALVFGACSANTAATQGQRLTGPTDSFKFTVIKGGTEYRVSAGTATEGTVIIPAYYRPNADSDYLPVTEIGNAVINFNKWEGGFAERKDIIKITIPSTVTSIGEGAFAGCTNLTDITIGSGVTSISAYAFVNCFSLTSIIIPKKVTIIGIAAFRNCWASTSVTFQGTIPLDGFHEYAFDGDLRAKFYATNSTNGTPGTYTKVSGATMNPVWTKQ